MRRIKIIVAAAMALVALSAIASATASAALPEFLAGSGTFTGTSGKGTLETKAKGNIECESSTSSGELTGVKTGTLSVDFKKCKALGFAANSLGDASEVILFPGGETTLCYISASKKEVGVSVKIPSSVHIEVPTLGILLSVTGAVVGKVEKINTSTTKFTVTFAQSKGSQSQHCEGGKNELLTSENEGTAEESGEATTGEIVFGAAHELMA